MAHSDTQLGSCIASIVYGPHGPRLELGESTWEPYTTSDHLPSTLEALHRLRFTLTQEILQRNMALDLTLMEIDAVEFGD